MKSIKIVTALVVVLSAGSAAADRKPFSELTPEEQNSALSSHSLLYAAVTMDAWGNKISDEGRFGFLRQCFEGQKVDVPEDALVRWALCGDDVKAAANMADKHGHEKSIEKWMKIGEAVEAGAKKDPGWAAVLKLHDDSVQEWKTFIDKNKATYDLFQKEWEGISKDRSDPAFQGCWEATQPAFAKLVKSTKFTWDTEGDPLPARLEPLLGTLENYVTVANFAMCAWSQHISGGALASGIIAPEAPGVVRFGPRSLLIAKVWEPTFKPNFKEDIRWYVKDTNVVGPRKEFNRPMYLGDTQLGSVADVTPVHGEIAKLVANGDDTTIKFKSGVEDQCTLWVDTKKIQGWALNGDPMYVRICKKREKVKVQGNDDAIGTKFASGLAPGVHVVDVFGIPVEAYKGKKFVAILGVSVKGSPAETPRKE